MRLIDLLLVLLFEGRAALPKSAASASAAAASGRVTAALRRMDSAGEKTHRQLIDCIRSKVRVCLNAYGRREKGFLLHLLYINNIECDYPQDTDALVEAIESGNVEVNFMDDVGQTLLNWASAFGTQEMVEFLCRNDI